MGNFAKVSVEAFFEFGADASTAEAVSGLAAYAGKVWRDNKAAKTAQARRLLFIMGFP